MARLDSGVDYATSLSMVKKDDRHFQTHFLNHVAKSKELFVTATGSGEPTPNVPIGQCAGEALPVVWEHAKRQVFVLRGDVVFVNICVLSVVGRGC